MFMYADSKVGNLRGILSTFLSFTRARTHIPSSSGSVLYLLSIFRPTPNSLTNPHERLTSVLGRVFDEIRIHIDIALLVEGNNCAASVLELSETLRSADLTADCDSMVVDDAADQHGADCDDGDAAVGVGAFDDHDAAPVLAEDVERAGLRSSSSVDVGDVNWKLNVPR